MKSGIWYWVGHISALLLASAMVIALPFGVAARDMEVVLFSPQRVQTMLQTRLVSTGLLDRVLMESLFEGRDRAGGDEWFTRATMHLSRPEQEELLSLLVPEGWVEDQMAGLSSSALEWIESDQATPDLVLDLRPIKSQLLGDTLDQAVEIFVDSWPSCSPEEVDRLQRAFEGGGDFTPIVCEPPEPLRSSVVDFFTRALGTEAQTLPDRVSLLDRDTINLDELQSAKRSLRNMQIIMASFWLVPIAALGPIMALKIRSFRDLGRWWGLPLFLAGLATLVLNLILRSAQRGLTANLLLEFGPPDSMQYDLVAAMFRGAAEEALRLMFVHGVVIAVVGGVGWLLLSRSGRASSGAHRDPSAPDEWRQTAADQSTPPEKAPPSGEGADPDEGPPSGIFG